MSFLSSWECVSLQFHFICLTVCLFLGFSSFPPFPRWPNCRTNVYFSQIRWLTGLFSTLYELILFEVLREVPQHQPSGATVQVVRKDDRGYREQTIKGSCSGGGLGGAPMEHLDTETTTLGTGRICCIYQIIYQIPVSL